MMAAGPRDPAHPERGGVDPDELQAYFVKSQAYTAGLGTRYPEGPLVGPATHQELAAGFPIGMRFHSAPVVRIADAKPLELGHVHEADGAWRLYAFADRSEERFHALVEFLAAHDSPVARFTRSGLDPDAVIDVRGILQRGHRDVELAELRRLQPRIGPLGLTDYEKAFSPDLAHGPDIFDARGIDRERGAIVLVRPDQYVAHVVPLDAHAELSAFLGRFLVEQRTPVR